jgi:hypothetical protein
MFSFFKSATVDATIEKIDSALSELDTVIAQESAKRDQVVADIELEQEVHSTTLTAIQEEFNIKVRAETDRHTFRDSVLASTKFGLTKNIEKGRSFVDTVRKAITATE